MSKPFIVIQGDIVNGFAFVGPFADADSALTFCRHFDDDGDWSIAPISSPNDRDDDGHDWSGYASVAP